MYLSSQQLTASPFHFSGKQSTNMLSYIVTGGTGNVSSAQLHAAGHKVTVASTKSPEGVRAPYTGVKFDWTDGSAYSNTLKAAYDIKGVSLIHAPSAPNAEDVKKFIKLTRDSGVNRFATTVPLPAVEIEDYIKVVAKEGVEWTILGPSWFHGKSSVIGSQGH